MASDQPYRYPAPPQRRADAGPCSSSSRRRTAVTRVDVGGLIMLRADALQAIYPDLQDRIVVTIMGAVAAELYMLGHRPNFFYLEHAMGLASSMGLGIALAMPEQKVIVIDGDGSLLMNLGTLSTMARYRPGNLLHIVFDNESLVSVGGFPTATATGTDLAGIARASGVPCVREAHTPEALKASVTEALAGNTLTTIISKVEAVGRKSFPVQARPGGHAPPEFCVNRGAGDGCPLPGYGMSPNSLFLLFCTILLNII